MSEPETQIIANFIKNNLDAEFFIDYHNISSGYPMSYSHNETDRTHLNSLYRTLSKKWSNDYPQAPQDGTMMGYLNGPIANTTTSYASELSNVGLDLERITNGNYKNILLLGFDTGIRLANTMKTKFDQVSTMFSRKHGLHITYGVSTTTRFYNSYFGQSPNNLESYPIKIENETALGVDFYSCCVESTAKGIDLGSANTLNFQNLYTENVPANTNTVEPIIKIGTTETTSADKGNYIFMGGNVAGTNGSGAFIEGSKIVEIGDHSDNVLFMGVKFARSRKVVEYSANAKSIVFIACTSIQVTSDINKCNQDGKIKVFSSFNASNKAIKSTEINDIIQKTHLGQYRIRTRNSYTYSDLEFENGSGDIPFALDAQANIHYNHRGNVLNIKKSSVYGPIERPDFSGLGTNIKILTSWVEEVDGKALPFVRLSDGQIYMPVVLRSTTNNRPVDRRYNGMQYYDTTLNKPIWWSGNLLRWENALGEPV